MKTRLEAVPSQVSLWWTKLGKWQALMVVVVLTSSFVNLNTMGDMKEPAFSAIIAAIIAVIAAAIFTATNYAIALAAFATAIAVTTASITIITIAVTIATIAAFAKEVPGINKKVIRLSYAGEFLLISLPIWWFLRG